MGLYDYYNYYTPDMVWTGGLATVFASVYLLVMLGIAAASYVLQSVSYYKIAKRRGIQRPWLAWIPVGNQWILGSISDQYWYVVKGQVKNKRKVLVVLNALVILACVAFVIAFLIISIGFISTFGSTYHINAFINSIAYPIIMIGISFALSCLCIATAIIQYIALYDLYSSCDPNNKVVYLVLSIFISGILPVFLFVCRNKDEGMPSRRQPVAEQINPPAGGESQI